MTKTVAVVVQRYGEDIVGGAEAHARTLAEQLHARLGWHLTVLTTCAQSYQTWANAYPAGESQINGIKVMRFRTWWPRVPAFALVSRVLLRLRRTAFVKHWTLLNFLLEWLWIIAQGPFCPGLPRYLRKHHQQFDHVILFTYLYYPTIACLRIRGLPSIFIPTAHDEPALYFALTRQSFLLAQQIFANSTTEQRDIERVAPVKNISVVGLGIDTDAFVGATKKDYVLYLGRISRGKGVDTLVKWFTDLNPGCMLLLAGVREEGVEWPSSAPIKYVGVLNDQEKLQTIGEARCMINPSSLESLSLIVLEAAVAGVPILVNRSCAIFAYYEEQMPSVFGYASFDEFSSQLRDILHRDWAAEENARQLAVSRQWVDQRYGWQAVLQHFANAAVPKKRVHDGYQHD